MKYRYKHRSAKFIHPATTWIFVDNLQAAVELGKICRQLWGNDCMGNSVWVERHTKGYRIQIQGAKEKAFQVVKTWKSRETANQNL